MGRTKQTERKVAGVISSQKKAEIEARRLAEKARLASGIYYYGEIEFSEARMMLMQAVRNQAAMNAGFEVLRTGRFYVFII